jgi:hypothetical protein
VVALLGSPVPRLFPLAERSGGSGKIRHGLLALQRQLHPCAAFGYEHWHHWRDSQLGCPSATMSLARTRAWWRQACNDLDLASPHTHGLPKPMEVLEHQGVDASGLANLPLRALTRMTVTSSYHLEDTAPMDLFEPSDSEQAISMATEVLAWVERPDQGDG